MKRSILVALLVPFGLSACMGDGPDPRAVQAGDLPPISRDYRRSIQAWARTYYAAPRSLRAAAISDPILTRDSTGRLLWLVCLEAGNRAAGAPGVPPRRQAFGFAPNYVSAPLARGGASLVHEDCDRPLVWRAFPQIERL